MSPTYLDGELVDERVVRAVGVVRGHGGRGLGGDAVVRLLLDDLNQLVTH